MEKELILIVEDDEFFSGLVAQKLNQAGFEVLIAHSGKEAFEIMAEKTPALMILDLMMPEMDGFEVVSRMKKDEKLKSVPVVVLSNLGQREEVDKAMALGADDFLIKVNFTLDEIVEKIKEMLQKKYI